MAQEKPKTRKEFEALIIAKAWKDQAYHDRLAKDPTAVVQEELEALSPGAKLPETLKVFMHEETPNEVHLVVPRSPQLNAAEQLTDADMDQVAGGTGLAVVVTVNTVAPTTVNAPCVVNAPSVVVTPDVISLIINVCTAVAGGPAV